MTSFALIALFKNEAMILREWIDHYLSQGANRIILVNNNSQDDWFATAREYSSDPRVAFLSDPRLHSQSIIYNDVFASSGITEEWLLVCDLDEFVYARGGYTSIVDYLFSVSNSNTSIIKLPWKMFGSSGFVRQPIGAVRKSFTWRDDYGLSPHPINCKYFVRVASVNVLHLHHAEVKSGICIRPSGDLIENSQFAPVSEPILSCDCLHLNHYAIQSRQFFETVKMTRGDAFNAQQDFVRTPEYFHSYDHRDLNDLELHNLLS